MSDGDTPGTHRRPGEVEVPEWLTYTWPALTVVRPSRLADATPTVPMISFSAAAVLLGAARRAIDVAVESAEHKRRRRRTRSSGPSAWRRPGGSDARP